MSREKAKPDVPTAVGAYAVQRRPDLECGMFQFWAEEKIRNMDTDQYGHVNNAAIATYCESGRISLFADRDLASAMGPFTIVVARLLIEFQEELFFPGNVIIGTNVAEIGNASLQVVQSMFKANVQVASSKATCVLLDVTTKKPTRVPTRIRTHLLNVRPARYPGNSPLGVSNAH